MSLSDHGFLRLETRGRKTSLPHIVELRFVALAGSYYVFAGSVKSDWVLNSLGAGDAKVLFSAFSFMASVRRAGEEEGLAAEREFAMRFGRDFFEKWYRSPRTCIRLNRTGPIAPRRASRGEVEAKTTYAEWRDGKTDFYTDVGGAFDLASEEYDFTIRRNFINTWIRRRSIAILRSYLRPDDVILEIGSGTGAETVEIAEGVRGIVAIDISKRMVELLSAKAMAKGLSGKVQAYRFAAADVSQVSPFLGRQKVRLAFSFNGALNCEPRIEKFVESLHGLLEADGYFICSVRNTVCLSEMLSHALVLQFGRATPRKHQPSMVSVGGTEIPSTYYAPHLFARLFEPRFKLRRMFALPALLPPAYLSNYYFGARKGISFIERLDPMVSGRFPFKLLGDQTMFVFQKA